MPPDLLTYHRPAPTRFPWETVRRFIAAGPVAGALVGALQNAAAVLAWSAHGQPDFYFRGSNGVLVGYVALAFAGGFVGIAYGAVLWSLEYLTHRRIRLPLTWAVLLPISFTLAAVQAWIEIDRRQLFRHSAAYHLVAVVVGLVLSAAFCQKSTLPPGNTF
jgi:hypothetical protein